MSLSQAEKFKATTASKATGTAAVIQHPASADKAETGEKTLVPAELLREVETEATGKGNLDGAKKFAQAVAQLCAAGYETQYGSFILKAQVGHRVVTVELESVAGADYIRQVTRQMTGKMPGKTAIEDLRAEIRIAIRSGGHRIVVRQRVAEHTGQRVIDLGDNAGNVVLIGPDGWQVQPNHDIAFIRGRGYGALPLPVKISGARAAFTLLFDWLVSLGIRKDRAPLVVVALVTWLRTGNAYPLLLFFGPGGCGKTTAARLILLLIDPTESKALPNIQVDGEHLGAAAQHRWVLSLDNESRLTAEQQDLLCTCATGGEIMVRELYTNGGVAILPIHRPVIITALQPVVTRPDLMTRTIPVEFAQRDVRKREDAILTEFEELRPALLGALCELLVEGEKP